MASPDIPFLPARPDSCTNSSSVGGDPKLIILVISGQSTPKPKAVVAIKSCNLVSLLLNYFKINSLISEVVTVVNTSTKCIANQ